MKKLAVNLLILALPWLAQGGQAENGYKNFESVFRTGSFPEVITQLETGWYSGRCYTRSEPKIEKAGVLVVIHESHGTKIIVPAGSLRSEPDYFDEISGDKYDFFREEIYEKTNPYSFARDGVLLSHLHYGILIGTLHVVQLNPQLLGLTMTNFEESPLLDNNSYFYCKISTRKIRDL
ncbi:MAG: hypothetical protein IPM57_07110 [Oligoflexia bacterium]|nr:hypothetical protein [Oligoflexia bacterium]